MAAVTQTEKPGGTYLHSWTLTTADPTGDAVEFPGAPDKTVFITSAAWGAATCVLEGSLDGGTTYVTLHDTGMTALSFTANNNSAPVNENVLLIRPRLSVVGAGATVSVKLLSRSAR